MLIDYVDFVVHIFSESARKFYDLERLWKTATRIPLADLEKPARKPAAKKTTKPAAPSKSGQDPRPRSLQPNALPPKPGARVLSP